MTHNGCMGDVNHHLRHIRCMVADALKAAGNVAKAEHRLQMVRISGCLTHETLHRLALELVKASVPGNHALREGGVLPSQRVEAVPQERPCVDRHTTQQALG